MCPPNAFDFSAFIKFLLVSPSEATPYLPSFCPTTQGVSMNAEKFACFFYGISSKIRYFRLFAYHNNLSPFDLYFQTCDHVILFFAPQRYSYRPQSFCVHVKIHSILRKIARSQRQSRAFPIEGSSGAGSDRWAIFSPTCGTGGLKPRARCTRSAP